MAKPRYNKRLYKDIPKPLRPLTNKRLRRQAAVTIKKSYRPAFSELNTEATTMQNLSAKRSADNAFYLDWLNTKTDQHNAAQAASLAAAGAQQQGIATQAAQDYNNLRDKLVKEASPGAVTNPNQQAAFNVTPEAQRGISMVANEREKFAASRDRSIASGAAMKSSNFATMAAMQASNQSDLFKAMSEISGARKKLIFSRAADTSKEAARLLDREITKAQAAMTIRGDAGQLAESRRAAQAGERTTRRGQDIDAATAAADRAFDYAELKTKNATDLLELAQKGKIANQQQGYVNKQITQGIYSGMSAFNSLGLKGKSINEAARIIWKKNPDIGALLSQAAAQMSVRGYIGRNTAKALKASGYKIPKSFKMQGAGPPAP